MFKEGLDPPHFSRTVMCPGVAGGFSSARRAQLAGEMPVSSKFIDSPACAALRGMLCFAAIPRNLVNP